MLSLFSRLPPLPQKQESDNLALLLEKVIFECSVLVLYNLVLATTGIGTQM